MKKLIFLLLVVFVLSGCKTMLDGTYEVRDATPEDVIRANASQEYRDRVATAKKEREMELAEESAAVGVGLIKVIDDGGGGWVKQITFSDGTVAVSGSDATVTVGGVFAGSGSVTTVDFSDDGVQTQVGDPDIKTLNFGIGIDALEAPDTEVDLTFDLSPGTGSATLVAEDDALQVKYNTTDFGEAATGLVLGASPTIATSVASGTDPADAGALRLPNVRRFR